MHFVSIDSLVGGAIIGRGMVAGAQATEPVSGATVHVYARGTTNPVSCFTDQHGGGSVAAQPFTTDADGHVVTSGGAPARVFVAQPQELDVAVSGGGLASAVTIPAGEAADEVVSNPVTADYTLVLADDGRAVDVNAAGAVAITVPPHADVPWANGAVLEVARLGAGAVSINAGVGVTLLSKAGAHTIADQNGSASLRHAPGGVVDTWLLVGDLA